MAKGRNRVENHTPTQLKSITVSTVLSVTFRRWQVCFAHAAPSMPNSPHLGRPSEVGRQPRRPTKTYSLKLVLWHDGIYKVRAVGTANSGDIIPAGAGCQGSIEPKFTTTDVAVEAIVTW
jgi:hypothetical protein